MADTSNSVLFDQPGPKGRRTIRIVNWVAALIFVGVLVLILMRLHNPPDGENQLTSRSGRRVALAESLWAESNLAETPAHVEELLAGALDTTLPELPDEKTIASHLLYQFDCIAVPDDPMSVETGYDAEGRELTLYDLSELRERVKDFLISEEMEDMLSSTYLPPYDGGELSPQDQAVAEAFLAICERDTDGLSVSIPAVSLVSWDGPDENGMILSLIHI